MGLWKPSKIESKISKFQKFDNVLPACHIDLANQWRSKFIFPSLLNSHRPISEKQKQTLYRSAFDIHTHIISNATQKKNHYSASNYRTIKVCKFNESYEMKEKKECEIRLFCQKSALPKSIFRPAISSTNWWNQQQQKRQEQQQQLLQRNTRKMLACIRISFLDFGHLDRWRV